MKPNRWILLAWGLVATLVACSLGGGEAWASVARPHVEHAAEAGRSLDLVLPLVAVGGLTFAGMLDLRPLFTPAAIIRYLKALPILKTPVMDTIFTNRPQHPLPLLGVDDISPVVHALPVVKRGAPSIPALKESGGITFYEPFPVRPNVRVSGVDLNNLKVLGQSSRDAWAQNKTDYLRRAVRQTVEAMCAVSLTGTLSWPVALESGGFDTYEVEYGSILTVVPGTLWDAGGVTIFDIWQTLTSQQEALQAKGYGGTVELWAGKTAYGALFKAAENLKSTAKIRVEISDQGINVGGYLVKRRAEQYRNPQTGAMAPVVGDKVCKMIALDAGHLLPYCALDDLDSNLQPLPFFAKPVKKDDPSGYMLIGESKPFPVPNVKGICDATVTS